MAVNKVRRRGSYAPLSAHYYKDDAIDEAGLEAELLYVRGLAFCADVLSDGFISERQLTRFVGVGMTDVVDRARTLVEVGLWEKADGGYIVRSWLEWNRSRDEIRDYQVKDADRKRPAGSEPTEPNPPDGGGQPADRNPNGIRTESETASDRSPDGIRPRARTPRHGTEQQEKLDLGSTGTPVDRFDEIWSLNPRKVKKQEAVNAWRSKVLKGRVDQVAVLAAYRAQIVIWQRDREFPRYVPHLSSWLNGRRWNDEIESSHVAPVPDRLPNDPGEAMRELRARAEAVQAARLTGLAYVERPQPPDDPTPYPEWRRARAVEWIDDHADQIRSSLARRCAG